MEKSSSIAVAVFVKMPIPGRVKTRLGQQIGAESAAQWYREMVLFFYRSAIAPLNRDRFCLYFLCDPMVPIDQYKTWLPENERFLQQRGEDLGQRMKHATHDLLKKHAGVIVVGSDCLEITVGDFSKAAQEINRPHTLVVGPAEDGGYYLIGMGKPLDDVFENMRWSESSVFEETRKRARNAGWEVRELDTKFDIDTREDLERLEARASEEGSRIYRDAIFSDFIMKMRTR